MTFQVGDYITCPDSDWAPVYATVVRIEKNQLIVRVDLPLSHPKWGEWGDKDIFADPARVTLAIRDTRREVEHDAAYYEAVTTVIDR